MNIKLDENYRLTSDEYNVILQKERIVKEGKTAGELFTENVGFYTNIEDAITAYIRKRTISSEATTLLELKNELLGIKNYVKKLLSGESK